MLKQKELKQKYAIITAVLIVLVGIYLFQGFDGDFSGYVFNKRLMKGLTYLLVGLTTTFSTFAFQAVSQNRLITPTIIGLDNLYILIQTIGVYTLGRVGVSIVGQPILEFIITAGLVIGFVLIVGRFLISLLTRDLTTVLLFGLVIGTSIAAFSNFFQVLMNPNEFDFLQSRIQATFQNVDNRLVFIVTLISLPIVIYLIRISHRLDVIRLGSKMAVNFGIDLRASYSQLLTMVVVLTSITTALVGPMLFLSFVVVNLTYLLFEGYWHRQWFIGGTLISWVILFGGQLLVERVFNLQITLGMLVELVGGLLFIATLIWRQRDAA